MKNLAIFDLDGTLLNTIGDLGRAANHALAAHGFPTHAPEEYPRMVGNGITRLIERALPPDSRNPETVERLRHSFIEYYDRHLYDTTLPYPGIPDLLNTLAANNIRLAVASNKYQEATERLIRHFFPTIPWVAVEGQRPGRPVKPDPAIIDSILGLCPTPRSEILYVGDSGVDVATARNASLCAAAVTWGFCSEADLVAAGATHLIHSPADLLPMLL